jgi:S1-C subfamily serine protease
MYADAIAKIVRSVFPIFVIRQSDDSPAMSVVGTGFFVDDEGLFVTVDHFMFPKLPDATHYYYGQIPDQVCQPAVEIECIARDPARDLYLGRVNRGDVGSVVLATEPVRPGDSVCLSGYPMAEVGTTGEGGFVGNVRRYWQPSFVIDATRAVIDNRTYDGYIVQHACLPGMSGGPVFDVEGKVRGMAVANLTRTIPEPDGNSIVVSNGIVVDIEHIRGFVETFGQE